MKSTATVTVKSVDSIIKDCVAKDGTPFKSVIAIVRINEEIEMFVKQKDGSYIKDKTNTFAIFKSKLVNQLSEISEVFAEFRAAHAANNVPVEGLNFALVNQQLTLELEEVAKDATFMSDGVEVVAKHDTTIVDVVGVAFSSRKEQRLDDYIDKHI